MGSKVHRRRAVAVVAMLAATTLGSGRAGAATTPVMTVRQGEPTVATFPGIPGNYSGSLAAIPTPVGCQTAQPFSTVCDDVPIDVVPPDIDPGADWTMVITVTWRPTETNDNEVQSVQACDLDIYLWDDRQIARRDNPTSGTYTQLDSSGLSTQPEVVSTYAPGLGRYNLTVINFSGVNIDYTVKAELVIGTFEKPFEALAPSAKPPAKVEDGSSDPAPVDRSGDTTPLPQTPVVGVVAAPVLGDTAVAPDADFAAFDGGSQFDDALAAPAVASAIPALGGLRDAGDVSPALLVFWFVLAPGAVLGATGVFIARRRPVALRI